MRGKLTLTMFVIAMVAAGCPGSIDDPDSLVGELDCVDYTEQLFERSCAANGCHSTVDAEGELDLESSGLSDRLVDVIAAGDRCDDDDYLLVDPLEPEQSLMYLKMTDDPPCGDRMPLFERGARQFELDCMLEWIETL